MANLKTLGILGGLGPMSTVYFYEMLTRHTKALCDQDHIDIVISSKATTPDRTAYILGDSSENPLELMIEEAKKLEKFGADMIVVPCNTAHYFYDQLVHGLNIPLLNIIEETVKHIKSMGINHVGVLATEGTILSGAYRSICKKHGLDYSAPNEISQEKINSIIYDDIKKGLEPNLDNFFEVANGLKNEGCEILILGCTELSLIKKNYGLDDFFIDSLEVLAYKTIVTYGKTPIGFSKQFPSEIYSKI